MVPGYDIEMLKICAHYQRELLRDCPPLQVGTAKRKLKWVLGSRPKERRNVQIPIRKTVKHREIAQKQQIA